MTTETINGLQSDSRPWRVPLVADTPIRDPALDCFGFAEFANALALVIDHEHTATPLTVAISAPWGGGKSSVGAMVQTLLEERVARRRGDDHRLVCWFNAWEHEDAPHLGGALAAAVAREANHHRAWWRRVLFPLPTAMLSASERLRRTVLIAATSLAIAGLLLMYDPTRDFASDLFDGALPAGGVGVLGAVALAILVFNRVFATAKSAARFVDDPASEAARGTMAEVKQQLGRLIRHSTRDGRLVIFIDDLERCESDRALEVCRVASQLLAQEGVVTILLADMSPIAASAGERYPYTTDGAQPIGAGDIGRRYLEKIAQVELALPPPGRADMQRMIADYDVELRKLGSQAEPARRRRFGRRGGPWQGLTRAVERALWWPLLVWFLVLLPFAGTAPVDAEGTPIIAEPWDTLLVLMFLASFGIGIWSSVLRVRHRRRRARLKRRIEELKERRELSQDQVRAAVIGEAAPAAREAEHELISDLVSSSFLDSDQFRAVERFIADNPPRLPREAKRTFNHAQLLTQIARGRRMFGGEPELGAEHLAKWVVIKERWPAIGRAVLRDPDVIDRMEAAAGTGGLGEELDASELQLNDVPGLVDMLRGEPRLGGVIKRLVHFTPADLPPVVRESTPVLPL